MVGSEAEEEEDVEPSWFPGDNDPSDFVLDRRSAEVLECLQARIGFSGDPLGALVSCLLERCQWN